MSIDIDEFDFGFTAVDESELEAVQKATTKVESTSSKVEETEEKQNISTETLSKLINQIDPSLPIPEKVKQEIQYNTYYKSLIQVCERIKNVILDITDLDKKLSNFNFLGGIRVINAGSAVILKR